MSKEPSTSLTVTDGTGPSFVENSGNEEGVRVNVQSFNNLAEPDYLDMSKRLAAIKQRGSDARASGKWPQGGQRPRKTKLAVMGISSAILNKGDKNYAAAIRMANAYRKARSRELYLVFGHVSSGVSSLLATASLAMAGSRFLYERIAETGDYGIIKDATKAADSARQNELAAWELCSKESIAHKKAQAQEEGVPWLRVQDQGENKRGPKTNVEKVSMGSGTVVEYYDAG